ncbi:hypothetical protein [Methylophaga sp. OBS4]|uniref:hypothetical protein n=1 Tax=Methylophaga sp. OBS4 TaxID=2991935 RepID=UPI00225AB6E4|nr:hypothetical protein [Methylophaga sp. OBS4]MCX4186869.1 hypothetical protein [Methylophaga sp. OBS4]
MRKQFEEISKQEKKQQQTHKQEQQGDQQGDGQRDQVMMNLAGFNFEPVVNDWNQEEFAHVLYLFMEDKMERQGLKFEDIFVPSDCVMTWMTDNEGKPQIW